jgi:hypothetical protein
MVPFLPVLLAGYVMAVQAVRGFLVIKNPASSLGISSAATATISNQITITEMPRPTSTGILTDDGSLI